MYLLNGQCIHIKVSFKSGMHNIRPAGQKWPAEAFNLARLVQNVVLLVYFLDKCALWIGKNVAFWPLSTGKNGFLDRHEIWVVHPCFKRTVFFAILGTESQTMSKYKRQYFHVGLKRSIIFFTIHFSIEIYLYFWWGDKDFLSLS